MDLYRKRKIIRKSNTSFQETEDIIAVEKRLTISLKGEELISLYCSPSMIMELMTGLFFTQGLPRHKIAANDIHITCGDEIRVDIVSPGVVSEKGRLIRHLGGTGLERIREFEKVTDNFSISALVFKTMFAEFQKKSELFRLTGCFHSGAISDGKEILSFAEDIGRHNAVDKVIGSCILKDIPFTGKLLLVSCRISSEIVSKCLSCVIPILASVAAPTDLAVDMAGKYGVTLVGFVRQDRLNIYTNSQRIIR
jgi:FdhD protein